MNQNLISIFIILFSLYLPNKSTEAKPIKEQKDIVLENVRKSFFNAAYYMQPFQLANLKKYKSEENGNTPIKIVSI